MRQVAKEKAIRLELQLCPKLILLPLEGARINGSSLQSGRLPEAGRNEVIAGASAAHKDRVTAGERPLDVVGVLKPEFALFRSDYLIPPSEVAKTLFPDGNPSVHEATLVQLTSEQVHNHHFLGKVEKSLPAPSYTVLVPTEWLQRETYFAYLGGLAAFLLGGSGTLIMLFRGLAARARQPSLGNHFDDFENQAEPALDQARPRWWAMPLFEMERRPRLVWGMHLVYFGFVIAGSILVYSLHDVQALLLSSVGDALSARSGPLAAAAQAYASGTIFRAAAVTFAINFFLGSLLVLTLPSTIVPGSGIVMAALRSVLWGLLLAPSMTTLAYSMLPHSATMLLEGEGYILATLFGLFIPIHIFQSSLGGTPLTRFGRVLLLNLQANFWVAVVLAVAACYEATEVILMNR